MNVLSVVILSVVQGITEWLPVSSSGHLVLFQQFLGLPNDVFFDAMLHLATLLALVFVFRKDVLDMFWAVIHWNTTSADFKMFWYVVVGTIPIGLIGLLFRDLVESAFSSLLVVGLGLLFTGSLLWFTKYSPITKKRLSVRKAFLIGVFQVLALVPGVSRSGTTLSTSSFLGLSSEDAARFSFLLFLPAVLGAGLLQLFSVELSSVDWFSVIVGFVLTTTIGVFTLRWLLGIIKRGKLHYFSWYCWLVGMLVLMVGFLV